MHDVDPSADRRETLFGGYAGSISIVLAVAWFSLLLGRQVVSPLLPAIIDDLHISPSQAGFALTVMMGLYSVTQYPSGRFSDQLSRATVLVASFVLSILGFVLLTNSSSYAGFMIGVTTVGIGAGTFFSPSRALLSDLYVERRGEVFGVHTAAGLLGGACAAVSAGVVISFAVWQAAFVPSIALLVGVMVSFHLWNRESYVISSVDLPFYRTVLRLLASREIRRALIGYVLVTFALQAFVGFLPTLLQLEKGFSPLLASAGFGLIYLTGIVVGPPAGWVSDLVSRAVVIVCALAFGSIGLIILLVASSMPVIGAGIVLTAAGIWAYTPVVQAYLMDQFSDDKLGGDFGLLKVVYSGLGSLGPIYVGLVAERASYTLAFSGLVVCLLASALITLWTIRE